MMDRKHFLKLMGAGLVGVAGGSALAACGETGWSAATNWAWMGGDSGAIKNWQRQFARMRAAGIDGLLLKTADIEEQPAPRVIEAATQEGLEVHAWVITMMRGEQMEAHPDWYAVNREGVSTAEDSPYVDYYRFLTPCLQPVRDYLAGHIDQVAQTDGLAGVHLDYIRFPDVILPITLQPKYGLTQDKEYPRFDYGYHPACRAQFEQQTGTDPMDLDDPPSNEQWVQFRYDQITRVVNRLAEVVHSHNKMISAAVFPTPDIARRLVRQNWPAWPLDAVMPMMYHNFYDEPVDWIQAATEQGIRALNGQFPLYSGLFVPELTPDQLTKAVESARTSGASGITLFNARAMTEAHWTRLSEVLT